MFEWAVGIYGGIGRGWNWVIGVSGVGEYACGLEGSVLGRGNNGVGAANGSVRDGGEVQGWSRWVLVFLLLDVWTIWLSGCCLGLFTNTSLWVGVLSVFLLICTLDSIGP